MTPHPPNATAGCPSAEDLSSFLSGQASPAERDALLAHLDECADCREWAVSSSRALAELDADSTGEAPVELGPRGATRAQRHPRDRRTKPWQLRLAAGILVGVGLGAWISGQWPTGRSGPSPSDLVAALNPADLSHLDGAWAGRVVRGPGRGGFEPGSALAEQRRLEGLAVRAGATRVDLEVSLQLDAAASTQARRQAFERLAVVCEQAGLLGMEAEELRELATAPPANASALETIDRRLRARFDPDWFDAGALWQSARLAARSGNARYFAQRDVQQALARSAELEGLPATTSELLKRAATSLRNEDAPTPAVETFEHALLAFEP